MFVLLPVPFLITHYALVASLTSTEPRADAFEGLSTVTLRSSYMVIANLEPIIACVQLELLFPVFITLPLSTVNCICCFNLQTLRIMSSSCTSAQSILILTILDSVVASSSFVFSASVLPVQHNSLHGSQWDSPQEPFLPTNLSSMLLPFQTKARPLSDISLSAWATHEKSH